MPFPRRKATPEDDARAVGQASKIYGLSRVGGLSPSEIGRALRLPSESIERVLSSPEPERPSVAEASPGPALPGPSGFAVRPEQVPGPVMSSPVATGPYSIATVSDSLYLLCREIGIGEALCRGICRRFSNFSPDDFVNLERILAESGISRSARNYVCSGLREQLGLPTPAPPKAEAPVPAREEESATARLRRTLQETLELRQLENLLKNIDKPAENSSPELEKLRAENQALKEALRNHELAETLARQLQPLSDRLKALEERGGPAPLTKDDLILRGVDKSLSVLAQKAAETGELRKGLLDAGGPKLLLRTAEKLLSTPSEQAEVLLPPTPQQLEVLRERMEASETPGPGLIIPGNGKPARVGPEDES